MELRENDEGCAVGGYPRGAGQVYGLPEPHPVRDDRAFGMASGTGRIQNRRDIVVRQRFRRHILGSLRDQPLIGVVRRIATAQVSHAASGGEFQRRVAEFDIVEHHDRLAVTDDEAQLGQGQPPVHRRKYRANARAGELQLEQVGRIMCKNRYTVAPRDTEPGTQAGSQAAYASIEFGVGKASACGEVLHGDTVATRRRVMRNPVICRNRHRRPPDAAGLCRP